MKSKETFVARLFTKLDEEGIGYSIIKGYETHPYYENDIDLIVDPSDINKLIRAAQYMYGSSDYEIKIDRVSGGNIPGQKTIILFLVFSEFTNKRKISLLRLELFQGIYLAKSTLLSHSEILKERRFDAAINAYVMSREHEALVLFMSIHKKIRWVTKKNRTNNKINSQIQKLNELNKDKRLEIDNLLRRKFGGYAVKALGMLENKEYRLFRLVIILAKIMFMMKSIITTPCRFIRTFCAKFKWDIDRFLLQKYSIVYGLKGNNTQGEELSKYLLNEKIFRDIIVCKSNHELNYSWKIRKRRACEAVVILCSQINASEDFNLDVEIAKLLKAFLNFKAVNSNRTEKRREINDKSSNQ